MTAHHRGEATERRSHPSSEIGMKKPAAVSTRGFDVESSDDANLDVFCPTRQADFGFLDLIRRCSRTGLKRRLRLPVLVWKERMIDVERVRVSLVRDVAGIDSEPLIRVAT